MGGGVEGLKENVEVERGGGGGKPLFFLRAGTGEVRWCA